MRGLTKPVSGYSVDLELDETTELPECFYLKNNIFITPIDKVNRIVRITCKIIFDKEPSSKFITDIDTKEVKNVLKLISSNGIKWKKIISIWKGSRPMRPMTYDSLPFIGEEDNGVYVMSGGSFIGTHFSGIFGYWLANIVNYNLNIRYNYKLLDFNIFYSRLTESRSNTNKNIVLLILSSIALFKLYKKIKNKK
jgi:glycine/D-amino acid oxidase-like deaminating enzyme